MERRRVSATEKDSDGDILSLCNKNTVWNKVSKATAISHIENNTHEYYVNEKGNESIVIVKKDSSGNKYLTTTEDGHPENNLDELDDC